MTNKVFFLAEFSQKLKEIANFGVYNHFVLMNSIL
jgi:hypothetical protein